MDVRVLRYFIIFASAFWLDRWTKELAVKFLSQDSIFVNSLLNFSLQWNRGVSFSWLSFDSTAGVIALTLGVLAIIVLFGFYTWGQFRLGKILYAETFVLAGALSNVLDRFKHGAVIDFIDFHLGSWHFATFNVADIFICVGITWLMLMQIKEVYDAQRKNNR